MYKIKDHVIEVLNFEHGRKVKEYWEGLGVDVSLFFDATKNYGRIDRYYGLINGKFNNYSGIQVAISKTPIHTLPEEETLLEKKRRLEKELSEVIDQINKEQNKVKEETFRSSIVEFLNSVNSPLSPSVLSDFMWNNREQLSEIYKPKNK